MPFMVYGADTKVSDLTDITSPLVSDDLYIVDDPDVTPISRKINIGALLAVANDLDSNGDVANDSHDHTTTTLSGIVLANDLDAFTSANLFGRLSNETGSGGGTPLAVFNFNPTLTGALLAGILSDNDDMVFEIDADNDGSNKYSWTDGAGAEKMSLTEAGVLTVDSVVSALTGNATTATDTASKTGTGSTYATNTSPTFVTPLLGTPTSGVATNITGLPAAAVLTGTFGTGAYVMDTSLAVPIVDTPLIQDAATITIRPSGDADDYITTKTVADISYIGRDDDDDLIKLEANAVTIAGALVATSYGGITEANLVDKSATEAITGSWDYGGASELEIPNTAGDVAVGTAGDIAVDTTQKQLAVGDGSVEYVIPLRHLIQGQLGTGDFDADPDVFVLSLDADTYPDGIVITEWAVDCNEADPTTELDANLYFANDRGTGAFPHVSADLVDVIDTTTGNSAEVDMSNSDLGSGVIPTGKELYILIDADLVSDTTLFRTKVHFYIPES